MEAKKILNKYLKTGMMIRQAKECALICVEELHIKELKIIENLSDYLPVDIYTQAVIVHKKHFEKVKRQIEVL